MSFTLPLGSTAPDFDLPGVDGKRYRLADFADCPVLVVVFTCNHCHYAYGVDGRLMAIANEYGPRGVGVVTINSNDTASHPEDSFEHMVERHQQQPFPYPYLRDESQHTALDYGALRTPHFFVFGRDRKLRYTGRMDDNPRDETKSTTRELRDALDDILQGRPVRTPLTNPIGCNVKWRGQDEHWMLPESCDLV